MEYYKVIRNSLFLSAKWLNININIITTYYAIQDECITYAMQHTMMQNVYTKTYKRAIILCRYGKILKVQYFFWTACNTYTKQDIKVCNTYGKDYIIMRDSIYSCNMHATQHDTTQHDTTRHDTTQHNATQRNATQHNTTQHKSVYVEKDNKIKLQHV